MDIVFNTSTGDIVGFHEDSQYVPVSAYGEGFTILRATPSQYLITEDGGLVLAEGVTAASIAATAPVRLPPSMVLDLLVNIANYDTFAEFKTAVAAVVAAANPPITFNTITGGAHTTET